MMEFIQLLPKITFVVWFFLVGGSNEILKIGRSKNGYRKLKNTLTFGDKLFKRNYVNLSYKYKNYQRFFVIMTYIFYSCVLAFCIISISSLFIEDASSIYHLYINIKGYFIALPTLIFVIFNMRRPLNKIGVNWWFIVEEEKIKKQKHKS